jgi:hypothetical protein
MPSAFETQASSLNPVLWVKFDGTGTPTNSGSSNATISLGNGSGATTQVAGASNYGYTFNTADATRYNISALPANTLDDKTFTIESVAKFQPGTGTTYQTMFRSDNGNNSVILRVVGAGFANPGRVQVFLQGNAGTGVIGFSQIRVDDGAYHHIVLISYSTAWELYVDGMQQATGTWPAGTISLDTAGTRYISNAPSETSNLMTIDELLVYNYALNLTQIYNNAKTVVPTAAELSRIGGYVTTRPVAFYRADETVNSTKLYNSGTSSLLSAAQYEQTANASLTKTATGGPGTVLNGYYATTPTGINNGFSWTSANSITYALWFKRLAAPVSTSMIFSPSWFVDSAAHMDPNSGSGWAIGTNGKLTVRMRVGNTTVTLNSTSNICDNTWRHIAFVKSGANYFLYINGVQEASTTGSSSNIPSCTMFYPYLDQTGIGTAVDEFLVYPAAIGSSDINALYTAGLSAISVNYTNTTGATASADIPMPTHTAETVINVNYTSGVLGTVTAETVEPALSVSSDLDAFGVANASADIVNPTVSVDKNNDYAADKLIATALMTEAVITTTKLVNYSASPFNASALLGANVFAGPTVQDTAYELDLRQTTYIFSTSTSTGNDVSNLIEIGTQWDSGIKTVVKGLGIKPKTGVPSNGAIIKIKFDNTHLTLDSSGNDFGANQFNVYVFTSDPLNSKTFTTMTYNDMASKELLYTTRTNDADGNYIDLTAAFVDNRAQSYGIYIEHVPQTPPGNHTGTTWDRTSWAGSNLNTKLLYILTSEFVSKNINAVPMNATTAEMTDVTVSVERYVNYLQTAATASATIVHPAIVTEGTVNFPADPSTASALSIEPTLFFGAEVNAEPMIAFGQIQNVVVTAIKNVNIQVDATTVNALLHMPQAQIGEDHSSDTMEASALFVNPLVVLNESVAAMTTTASATMTDATAAGQLLGVIFVEPMRASVLAPNPPAYIDLFSDPWYATLYAQHSVRHGAPYGKAFLKLFEDQNTDITQATPNTVQSQNVFNGEPTLRQLRNNLTYGIVVNSGPENDIRYPVATAITDYSTATNESRMSVGYFDNWNRKAIRLQNIAFNMGEKYGYARDDFSLEFSIKTTKSDQVLAHGTWSSATGPGRVKTTYNLVDGKLNYLTYSGSYDVFHPKMSFPTSNFLVNGNLTGNKRIDDGQWHHVVIQYVQGPEASDGIVARFQIWIDGELDIQRFNQDVYDPDFIGANMPSTYASDFYTSAWSMDAPATVSERNIDLHYFDYIKYEPILAEPMTASLTMTNQNSGKGNRARALMLYWWPTSAGQNKNFITSRFDSAYSSGQGEFDINMSAQELETIDFLRRPPQQYFGWDVFPVDINGYFVSDLVKEQAYGGAQNIVLSDLGGAVLSPAEGPREQFKVNRRGYFRNTLDDTRRYLDLVNDIDLSQFDAIIFKNYPDQSNEVDAFARNEIVDPYFNIRETKIYEDFIKSLRAAVDTGISLMVNNPQLALDLKIVDRIEVVPDLTDGSGYYSDPYTPTIVPDGAKGLPVGTGSTTNLWTDTYRNNRIRILNTVPGVTDEPSVIYTDAAFWNNDDTLNYGGTNRPFKGFTHKPNGLAVGDEFFISTFNFGNYSGGGGSVSRNYLATPIANIKSGTPITAFANQYRRGLDLVDNPYKNYVTSIAIKPGDVLDGRQVGGKIWVNFTDAISQENDYVAIDGIHSYWINLAYQEGSISLEFRNQLLASADLLENKLNNGEITQAQYNDLSRWQNNGMNILTQATQLEVEGGKSDFSGDKLRTEKVTKSSKGGLATARTVSFGGQFFAFTYSRQFVMLAFEAISMNTRGFRWLSNRIEDISQTQSHTAMPASAEMVQPTIIAVKDASINAQVMVANAVHLDAVGFEGADRNILSLPMNVTALITQPVKIVSAAPMTATADTRQNIVIRTTAQDQVVVYVLHEDPILYLREDIIK